MRTTFDNAAYPVEPFTLNVPDSVLADLKERLVRTRLPDNEPKAAPWRYGTSLAYMRDVIAHWRDRYDWRAWEARINAFSHYKTTIGGKKIHFILERGSGGNPMPLLITHGWPGSFVEFLDIIEKLAHPERFGGDARDAFTVVAPSLPGYGFSDPPDAPIGPRDIAPVHKVQKKNVRPPACNRESLAVCSRHDCLRPSNLAIGKITVCAKLLQTRHFRSSRSRCTFGRVCLST